MALSPCKECGKEISDNAKTCPHCGFKLTNSSFIGCGSVIFIVLFLFGLLAIFSANKPLVANSNNQSSVPSQQTPSVTTQSVVNNTWQYESINDSISNESIQRAYISSENTTQLDFPYQGGTFAQLVVRYHPRHGKEIIFKVNKGQLHCQYNDCSILIRFDDGPVTKNAVSEPEDNSNNAYFLSNYNKSIKKIKNAKKMFIEVSFYSQGSYTFEFNIEDLDTVKLALLK